MGRIERAAFAAVLAALSGSWHAASAQVADDHKPGGKLPEVHAVTPPRGGSGEHKVTTPAETNNPGGLSDTRIIDTVRHPQRGIKAVRTAKPPEKISIVHVNTTAHGNRAAAIKAAAAGNLARIRDLREAVRGTDWLTLKLTSLHVDPNAIIGATTDAAGTLILIAY